MALTIQEKIQVDAIKNREFYKIVECGGYILLTNGSYGVYIEPKDLLIDPKKYEKKEVQDMDPWKLEEKEESAKVIKEAVTFGKQTANAVINSKKEKAWIWQDCLKKFGGKVFYGMIQYENGTKIITVSDMETAEIIGVIATIEDVEIQKNDTYQV